MIEWLIQTAQTAGVISIHVEMRAANKAAYALYRQSFPMQRFIRAGLLVPFVLPTVVVGVAFRELIGEAGLLAG